MTDTPVLRRRSFLARTFAFIAGGAWLMGKGARDAAADDQPYMGEIRMFAGTFAPLGWAFCSGQLLPISQYDALFTLLGTTYGGDGQSTFALPDLRSRAPVHIGSIQQGQSAGVETVTLTTPQIPSHTHSLVGMSAPGDASNPSGRVPSRNAAGAPHYSGSIDTNLAANALTTAGSSQPHDNMMPSLCINFIICLEGIYPSPS
jgi:microcystin-dependent protein